MTLPIASQPVSAEAAVLQIAAAIERWSRERRDALPPLVIGICGAQGSGKSTLSECLRADLEERGLRTAVTSLDDFYLPRVERWALAQAVHPFLRKRGVPGTHDVGYAQQILQQLSEPGVVSMPVFDKAIDDRLPQSAWGGIAAPVEVILFEGWCVGARPQTEDELAVPINELEATEDRQGTWRRYVNSCLSHEYATMFQRIDRLLLLEAPSFDVVHQWRAQQEDDLRQRVSQSGTAAHAVMTDDQLARFIRYYERLTRHILAEMPRRADLIAHLDPHRTMTLSCRGSAGLKR